MAVSEPEFDHHSGPGGAAPALHGPGPNGAVPSHGGPGRDGPAPDPPPARAPTGCTVKEEEGVGGGGVGDRPYTPSRCTGGRWRRKPPPAAMGGAGPPG